MPSASRGASLSFLRTSRFNPPDVERQVAEAIALSHDPTVSLSGKAGCLEGAAELKPCGPAALELAECGIAMLRQQHQPAELQVVRGFVAAAALGDFQHQQEAAGHVLRHAVYQPAPAQVARLLLLSRGLRTTMAQNTALAGLKAYADDPASAEGRKGRLEAQRYLLLQSMQKLQPTRPESQPGLPRAPKAKLPFPG